MNTIIYGDKSKLISPFCLDNSVIQEFSTQKNTSLYSFQLYIQIFNNANRDFNIKSIIIDSNQDVLFTKDLYMYDVYQSGFFKVNTELQLNINSQYFLCLDSFGNTDSSNYIGLYMGYRKKMMNMFLNNNFSIGQLYCKFNFLQKE